MSLTRGSFLSVHVAFACLVVVLLLDWLTRAEIGLLLLKQTPFDKVIDENGPRKSHESRQLEQVRSVNITRRLQHHSSTFDRRCVVRSPEVNSTCLLGWIFCDFPENKGLDKEEAVKA